VAEVVHCRGCGAPIEDVAAPDIIKAKRRSRLPSFSDRETESQLAYFHILCFTGQRGYKPVRG
jgi:hypothetical protein